jgi:prevent-host-death family protein
LTETDQSIRLDGGVAVSRMKTEIGSYEAKTKLPELLRQVQKGKSFTITNRGKAVAELVPVADEGANDRAAAVERMREFMRSRRVKLKGISIRELKEYGRD